MGSLCGRYPLVCGKLALAHTNHLAPKPTLFYSETTLRITMLIDQHLIELPMELSVQVAP